MKTQVGWKPASTVVVERVWTLTCYSLKTVHKLLYLHNAQYLTVHLSAALLCLLKAIYTRATRVVIINLFEVLDVQKCVRTDDCPLQYCYCFCENKVFKAQIWRIVISYDITITYYCLFKYQNWHQLYHTFMTNVTTT